MSLTARYGFIDQRDPAEKFARQLECATRATEEKKIRLRYAANELRRSNLN
jgi:hypothetical protein